MRFKAIFFDRDGTLTYYNPEKRRWRDEVISSWSGRPFELPYEKMMALYDKASDGIAPWYKTVGEEREFFKRYYRCLLSGEGIAESLDERADRLFDELWCNRDRLPYPETVGVLEYFKGHGYKMGVISDTYPSLELTLRQLGLDKYFTSFTASSIIGLYKPSPVIFGAALAAQDVTAAESLYVDDCDEEADGARALGFTAFNLDRNCEKRGGWHISSLAEIIDYVEGIK